MNQERIDKIKILIQTSPLLNSVERNDWMNLLELMNDKQVLELEKILSYDPKKLTGEAQGVPGGNNSSGSSQAPFSLSHIMNFPTNIPATPAQKIDAKPQLKIAPTFPPVVSAPKAVLPPVAEAEVATKPVVAPKTNKFGAWLKDVVSEKELPAPIIPKQEQVKPPVRPPVEIKQQKPAPVEAVIKSPIQKVEAEQFQSIAPIPKILEQAPQQKEVVQEVVPVIEQLKPILEAKAVQPEPVVVKPVQKVVEKRISLEDLAQTAAPVKYNGSREEENGQGDLPLNVIQEKKDVLRRSGLINIPKNFYAASAGPVTKSAPLPLNDQKKAVAPPVPAVPNSTPRVGKNLSSATLTTAPVTSLKGLDSVIGLSLESLREKGMSAFASLLRSGIASFGYHKTIQALEQSPLYHAYIDTGLQLLSAGKSFEELLATNSLDEKKFFNREEFENFTDALREIPATVQK